MSQSFPTTLLSYVTFQMNYGKILVFVNMHEAGKTTPVVLNVMIKYSSITKTSCRDLAMKLPHQLFMNTILF